MNESASVALKAAAAKLDTFAGTVAGADGEKIKLIGGIVIDVVAAVLHQWDAGQKSAAGRWEN